MDVWNDTDAFWPHAFFGKPMALQEHPELILYNFLATPRVNVPRWYLEGSAVFMETWMAGGFGRAQGGYDEMVFRAMVRDNAYFYSPVGLELAGDHFRLPSRRERLSLRHALLLLFGADLFAGDKSSSGCAAMRAARVLFGAVPARVRQIAERSLARLDRLGAHFPTAEPGLGAGVSGNPGDAAGAACAGFSLAHLRRIRAPAI